MKMQWILPLCLALAVPAALAQQNDATPPSAQPGANAPQQRTMHMEHNNDRGPQQAHFMMVRHDGPEGPMAEHGGMSMHHHGMEHGSWWKSPEMTKRVGLSPEQVSKLDKLSLDGQVEMIHLHASLEEQELMLRSTMEDPTLDQKKAALEIDKVADAHAALEKADAKLKLNLRTVLTPDQWTKLHTPPEHHMGHMGEWHGNGGPQAPGQGPA